MAEALVSPVVEHLVSIMARELEQEVRLVVGVENAVDQLTSNLTAIKAVLADAETRQVKEATVRDWLEKLRDVAYDIEDVLDDWEAAILSSQSKPGDEQDPKKPEKKVCSFLRSSCFCCKQIGQRHDIARKIKELNERLDRIAQERYRYHFDERENPPIERPMTTSRLFSESTHVRSLSLRFGDFAEIPPSIRKLVQLRWLDLSDSRSLKQLPETLCELQSLQTIAVSDCDQLKQLPLGIGKLINLRHLHNRGGPSRLPKGIGQLTGLRTLEEVDVGCGGDAFSLGDLKNLNQLRGRLAITELGKYNRHVGEAEQAELKKKEHITNLVLRFLDREDGGGGGEERWTPRNEELLLEALEPSPYLESLVIRAYRGAIFPGWMISLTNLRSIVLSWCVSCVHLPTLGKLPSLETLFLWRMDGVKKVGQELLGIETQIGDSKSEISASSSSSPVVVRPFPKLTRLGFQLMDSLEEWEDDYDGTTKPPPIIIMPSLRSLEINSCPRLKALPDYILQSTTLHALEITRCDLLEERYNKEKGEDWSKISRIPRVTISSPQGYACQEKLSSCVDVSILPVNCL